MLFNFLCPEYFSKMRFSSSILISFRLVKIRLQSSFLLPTCGSNVLFCWITTESLGLTVTKFSGNEFQKSLSTILFTKFVIILPTHQTTKFIKTMSTQSTWQVIFGILKPRTKANEINKYGPSFFYINSTRPFLVARFIIKKILKLGWLSSIQDCRLHINEAVNDIRLILSCQVETKIRKTGSIYFNLFETSTPFKCRFP